MTDYEYAAFIYHQLFKSKKEDGDIYVNGIFNAIKTLEKREQLVLEYYYRNDMTQKQVGEKIGISGSAVGVIARKALAKLRHPSRSRHMSFSIITKNYETELKTKDDIINDLCQQMENALKGEKVSAKVQYKLDERKTKIIELNFSARTENYLIRSGIDYVETLLSLDSLDELTKIHGFGIGSYKELLTKMNEHGYSEWVNKIMQNEQEKKKIKIDQVDFSARTYNALSRANITNIESLLAIEDIYDLWKIRRLGIQGINEIIKKMHEHGYIEWVDRMISEAEKISMAFSKSLKKINT